MWFSADLFAPWFFSPTSSLSTEEIESRSNSLKLFDTLKSDPEAFYSHMTKYVLPTVEGSDLGRLLYYYTLIDAAGCEPYVTTIIKPDSHVKLLKNLRTVAKGMFWEFFLFLFDDDDDIWHMTIYIFFFWLFHVFLIYNH